MPLKSNIIESNILKSKLKDISKTKIKFKIRKNKSKNRYIMTE